MRVRVAAGTREISPSASGWPSAAAITWAWGLNAGPQMGGPPRMPNGKSTTIDDEGSAAIATSILEYEVPMVGIRSAAGITFPGGVPDQPSSTRHSTSTTASTGL